MNKFLQTICILFFVFSFSQEKEREVLRGKIISDSMEVENITVLNQIQSVKKSIEWLNTNSHPDFIFSDIRLSDGEAFEIFNIDSFLKK